MKKSIIFFIALVLLVGVFFLWQYFDIPRLEIILPEEKTKEEIPGRDLLLEVEERIEKEKITEVRFICGVDTVEDTEGNIYETVESRGRCWLDRNLGASRVAVSYNDAAAYGHLFQWGRFTDGHQIRNSRTTPNPSPFDKSGHSNFIIYGNYPYDWRIPQNDDLWQGVDGINNPCPVGWRIPTAKEWEVEIASWNSRDRTGAYASSLKIPVAGLRGVVDGIGMTGTSGYYWSSTVDRTWSWADMEDQIQSKGLWITVGGAKTANYSRNLGLSVRCIRD